MTQLDTHDWPHELLRSCATRFGTPLHVYHLGVLRRTIALVHESVDWLVRESPDLRAARIFSFEPANRNPAILRTLCAARLGLAVARPAGLLRGLGAGFPVADIEFSGFGLSDRELADLAERGVTPNLASEPEVTAWLRLVPGRPFGLRVDLTDNPLDKRGVTTAQFREIACRPGARIAGLHTYVGTNIHRPEWHANAFGGLARLLRHVPTSGRPYLDYLNVGGGFGHDHVAGTAFDWRAYAQACAQAIGDLRGVADHPLELRLELGRSLTAACGRMAFRVLRDFRKQGQRFVVVDGSVSGFPRPVRYGFDQRFFPFQESGGHRFTLLPDVSCPPSRREDGNEVETGGEAAHGLERAHASHHALIVGNGHYSKDMLGVLHDIPATAPSLEGRLLVAHDTGAYVEAMSDDWLDDPRPAAVCVDDAEVAAARISAPPSSVWPGRVAQSVAPTMAAGDQ